jgi:hypothetical protein
MGACCQLYSSTTIRKTRTESLQSMSIASQINSNHIKSSQAKPKHRHTHMPMHIHMYMHHSHGHNAIYQSGSDFHHLKATLAAYPYWVSDLKRSKYTHTKHTQSQINARTKHTQNTHTKHTLNTGSERIAHTHTRTHTHTHTAIV